VRLPWARALVPARYLPAFDRIVNGALLGFLIGAAIVWTVVLATGAGPLRGPVAYLAVAGVFACGAAVAEINRRRGS
jgi:hypothetical protein